MYGDSGQIITTKPPVGHLKLWLSKGIPPQKSTLNSGLGLILICPGRCFIYTYIYIHTSFHNSFCFKRQEQHTGSYTLDGSEILHQLRLVVFSHYLPFFFYIQNGGCLGFLNHQQYGHMIHSGKIFTLLLPFFRSLRNR